MIYTGISKIIIKGNEYEAFIELNPEDAEILTRIPQNSDLVNSLIGDKDIFDIDYCITDFSCFLPNGKLTSHSIDHLQIKRINPGTFSIYDSSLVRSFTLDKKWIGIATLSFSPKRYIQHFKYESKKLLLGNSELVFYNHSISKLTSFKIGKRNISISGV